MYEDPTTADVPSICIAGSPCEDYFGSQFADALSRGEHIEGAEPITLNRVRDIAYRDDGGFLVSFWSNPLVSGTVVGPDRRVEMNNVPAGIGLTLIVVPYDQDTAFPWRVFDFTPDAS